MAIFPLNVRGVGKTKRWQTKERPGKHSVWVEEGLSIHFLPFSCWKASPFGASFKITSSTKIFSSLLRQRGKECYYKKKKNLTYSTTFLILLETCSPAGKSTGLNILPMSGKAVSRNIQVLVPWDCFLLVFCSCMSIYQCVYACSLS